LELNTLATMTRRAFSTMKSCDPAIMLLAASVLPRASSGGTAKATKYIAALQSAGWNVDAFTTHIYPENGVTASGWHDMLVDVKTMLATFRPPTSKLWVTETLYNLNGPVIPEEQAGSLVDDTYNYATQESVQQIYWYAWDRPDLGGLQINANSQAWLHIKSHA
jgi:hypothetical protein